MGYEKVDEFAKKPSRKLMINANANVFDAFIVY